MIQNYKDLEVWKKGVEIVDYTYKITNCFPKEERYGLSSQMQRASVSIPANLAEGHARQHTKEYKQFCSIAIGSCAELETLSIIAKNQHFLDDYKFEDLMKLIEHELRMLKSLIKKLNQRLNPKP